MKKRTLNQEIAERIYQDIKGLNSYDQTVIVNILAQKVNLVEKELIRCGIRRFIQRLRNRESI